MRIDCSGLHGNLEVCDYAYGVVCGYDGQPCQASSNVYKGITQLWEAIVCPKNKFDEWHKWKCLFGKCLFGTCLRCQVWMFYPCVQTKLLDPILFWYSGHVLLLKQQCQRLATHRKS
jgi:hypothetical protein